MSAASAGVAIPPAVKRTTGSFPVSEYCQRKYVLKIPGDQVWEFSVNRGWTSSNIEEFQDDKLNFVQRVLRIFLNLAYKNSKLIIVPSQQLANLAEKWRRASICAHTTS